MKLHKIALAVFLGAASMAAFAADNSTSQSPKGPGSSTLADTRTNQDDSDALRILRPRFGETVMGTKTVQAVLRVGDGIHPESLRITLNGKNVTRHLHKEECTKGACKWTMELTKGDRLRSGTNEIRAAARGHKDGIELARVSFDYYYGLGAGQNQPNYVPPSVGLSLTSGGAQPWVTLTTGTPAGLQDSLDPTQYSLPYPDTTFPTGGKTPCSSRYQVVVLNRFNPAQQDGYYCPGDSATLKSDLAGLPAGTELVIVGTTQNNNADASLDTTSIGGTNYSGYSAAWQPQGYAAVGVSGATAGSAYENYYLSGDVGKAYQQNSFANGILAKDGNGNYNFHAANNVQFEVYPNNPTFSNSTVSISYNTGSTLTLLPPVGSANGIWLLVLDRVTLDPIDLSDQGSCGGISGFCGTFYPTGNSDENVAWPATQDLIAALAMPTSRQLIVLTTVGQPFQSSSDASALVTPMSWYGGAGYRLEALTSSTSTYTLVSPGRRDWTGNWPPAPKSPFSTAVVNSSTVFSLGQGHQNRQTGIVRGVMARDNNSLYFSTVVSQYDPSVDANGNPTTLSIDYDFYSISTQMPIDWPLTDTSGHIAAYHFASEQFLSNHFSETGSHAADLRYFYTDPGDVTRIGGHNTDFQCSQNPTVTNCIYPGDGHGFTQQDLADANAQLYTEVTALGGTDAYLGANGIGGLVNATADGSGVSDQLIASTYQVLNGQVGATASTGVSTSAFDWMNLFAGLTSVVGAVLGPADVPIAAAAFGATSGLLWSGSALDPWWQGGGGSSTPPSYEDKFDTTLGNLEQNESVYATNLATSYGTALDDIYTDWGKLSATGAKTANSDSGWSFSDNVTGVILGGQMADGVRRSIYLQLLPQFYSQDTYVQQPVAYLAQLGNFYSYAFGEYAKLFNNSCYSVYPSSTLSSGQAYSVYGSAGNVTLSDMYVMGGTINNQNTPKVTESMPTADLLSTLFNAPTGNDQAGTGPLNIPQELVYGTAALPDRSGPSLGNYDGITQCYKPGCSDQTTDPTQSSCIKP
jgi:hypothetical protein